MSGECERSGQHCLDCKCASKRLDTRVTYLTRPEPIPLGDGENPPAELPPVKWVNVIGREEHEAILKDARKCQELGLDQMYEVMVYLKRWGGWL